MLETLGFEAMAVENSPIFLTIRDATFKNAKKMIAESSLASLAMRYKPQDQTTVFFAAARKPGADREAKCLCEILVQKGIRVNHTDEMNQTALFYAARQGHAETIEFLLSKGADPNVVDTNGETALFYAVRKLRTAAAKALLDGGANLEVSNNAGNTCMSVAPAAVFPALQEERTKRRLYHDNSGPGPKRRRTAMEGLRAWANEWPAKEPIPRSKKVNYKQEDIIDKNDSYAVLRTCPAECAAQLRICEKIFVADHAQLLQYEAWFSELSPEEWCQGVGVLANEAGVAVEAIKVVVRGKMKNHFTLPLVERKSMSLAGYVHARYAPKQEELSISHVKVNERHMNRGCGKLLLAAAEEHSHRLGWKCNQTYLSVLKANERARRCYTKAGFKFESSRSASWGKKEHSGSEWQRWKKVHKHSIYDKKAPVAQ